MAGFDATRDSGPDVARLFLRLLAAIFCVAWASLGWQLDVLIGQRGLLPAAPFLEAVRAQGVGFAQVPSVFWLRADDVALHGGIWLGLGLSLAREIASNHGGQLSVESVVGHGTTMSLWLPERVGSTRPRRTPTG